MKSNLALLSFPGGRWTGWGLAFVIIIPMLWQQYQRRLPDNGFDLADTSVPAADILSGGPGRDGIPALTNPITIQAAAADYLQESDRVIGILVNDEARAYPLRILNWHEIVNDHLSGEPIVVTYCPLCGTGIAFHGALDDEIFNFGVSGLLYRDNLLMYDRATQSLWSQISGMAVSGKHRGRKLQQLSLVHATWGEWRRAYPHTDVLSLMTGYRRDYAQDPYREYARDPFGPSPGRDQRLLPKSWIIGVEHQGESRAYPFSTLALIEPAGIIRDQLGGELIEISYNAIERSASVRDEKGRLLPMMLAYWFAWSDAYPQTGIYGPHTKEK